MARITCRCGNWISNSNTDPSPYRADLIPESASADIDAAVLSQLKALIQATKAGVSVSEFVAVTQSTEEVVEALLLYKIFGEPLVAGSRQVMQCESCGRLLVETNQPHTFQTFLPESEDSFEILGG